MQERQSFAERRSETYYPLPTERCTRGRATERDKARCRPPCTGPRNSRREGAFWRMWEGKRRTTRSRPCAACARERPRVRERARCRLPCAKAKSIGWDGVSGLPLHAGVSDTDDVVCGSVNVVVQWEQRRSKTRDEMRNMHATTRRDENDSGDTKWPLIRRKLRFAEELFPSLVRSCWKDISKKKCLSLFNSVTSRKYSNS